MSSSRHDRRHHEGCLPDERLEAVVAAASQGEGWAVAELYKELQPAVLGYLRAREPRHGDDLASDTWLKAAAGLPSFSGDASAFRSWLFAIARCRMIDHRRRARRRGTVIDLDALAGRASSDDPEHETLDALTAQAAARTIATRTRKNSGPWVGTFTWPRTLLAAHTRSAVGWTAVRRQSLVDGSEYSWEPSTSASTTDATGAN